MNTSRAANLAPITCPQPSVTISAATNRLVGPPYAYDASGNMTNDGINTLVYDAENHAVSATNGSSAGAYVYDGNGLRVQKCVPSCGGSNPNTVYIFSGSKVIAEYDNGAVVGSPSREYVYSGGALIAKVDSSGTKYYHQDHLSNRYVTDSSGNKAAEMGHFPYGESWYNASNDKLLFTSYERDAESGNDYAQARYNVSGLARFSSPDPIAGSTSDPQSLNRYSYVRNMPVMLSDPSGMVINCNTVKNSTDDQSASSDSDGHGMLPNEEMDPAEPQSGCPGVHTPPSGGGVSLDSGFASDDSGLGGVPIGGGTGGGFWQYTFSAASPSFHWGDYTVDQLLDMVDEGEITLEAQFIGQGPDWNNPTPDPTIGGIYGKATGKAFQLALKPDCAKFLQSVMQNAFLLENGLSSNSSPNALAPQMQTSYNTIQGINAAQLASSAYLVNMTNTNVANGNFTVNAQTRGSQIGRDPTLFLYQGFANKGVKGQAQTILHEGTHLFANATDNQLAAAAGVPNAMNMSQPQASAAYQAKLEKKCK